MNVSTVVCTVWLCFCLYLRFELSYRTIVSLVITRNNCDIVLSKDLRPTLVKLKLYYSNLSFITQYIQYYFYIKLTVKTTLTDLTAHIIQKTTLQIHILLIHFNTLYASYVCMILQLTVKVDSLEDREIKWKKKKPTTTKTKQYHSI